MKFRKFLFDAGGEGGGGAEPKELTVDELKEKIKNLEGEKSAGQGENEKLKKDLEKVQKELEKLQKQGKTQEQLDKEKNEELEKQLKEKENELNLMTLQAKKLNLISEHKISEHFVDFIALNPEMSENDLKTVVKNVADKQAAYRNSLLKEYSITQTPGKTGNNGNEKDIVDTMLENKTKTETDLTKFI